MQDGSARKYPLSWKPKPGDFIEGHVARYAHVPDRWRKGQTVQVCDIKLKDGRTLSIWIAHQHLRELFATYAPKVGELIRVDRLEDEEPQGSFAYGRAMYKLAVAGPEVQRAEVPEKVVDQAPLEISGTSVEYPKWLSDDEDPPFGPATTPFDPKGS